MTDEPSRKERNRFRDELQREIDAARTAERYDELSHLLEAMEKLNAQAADDEAER